MCQYIFLDESGDLGWSFKQGSTKFLTISALSSPQGNLKHINRCVNDIRNQFHWSVKAELKWSKISNKKREAILEKISNLLQSQMPYIKLFSITVYKPCVMSHIRDDPNKLYNYMVKLMLLKEFGRHNAVNFYPDPRSIKVNNGNNLNDYIKTELMLTERSSCKLQTYNTDSRVSNGIQIADIISGAVQSFFERQEPRYMQFLEGFLNHQKLYFS